MIDHLRRRAGQLPEKRVGTEAIVRNAAGEVLIVEPSYRPGWQLPGGAVENGESPLAGCRREVTEETGLDLPIEHLLATIYHPPSVMAPDILVYVFDGGVLSELEANAIRLPRWELVAHRFVAPAALDQFLGDRVRERTRCALEALAAGRPCYAEIVIPPSLDRFVFG